jgi:hypothetical protein
MKYERRMPRFEVIPMLEPPDDIAEWYLEQQYSSEEINVFRLRNIWIVSPQVENSIAEKVQDNIRDKERAKKYWEKKESLRRQNDVGVLLEELIQNKNVDSRIDIIDRLFELDNGIYKVFLENLKKEYLPHYFDDTMRVLVRTIRRQNITEDILDLFRSNKFRDPQDYASLLQVLGFIKSKTNLGLLYSFYVFYQDNFPDTSLFEGPLFGIAYYLSDSVNK